MTLLKFSWERMPIAFRLLNQQSSWSPCGDPFPNKPTPHGDLLLFFPTLSPLLTSYYAVAASLRADPFPKSQPRTGTPYYRSAFLCLTIGKLPLLSASHC